MRTMFMETTNLEIYMRGSTALMRLLITMIIMDNILSTNSNNVFALMLFSSSFWKKIQIKENDLICEIYLRSWLRVTIRRAEEEGGWGGGVGVNSNIPIINVFVVQSRAFCQYIFWGITYVSTTKLQCDESLKFQASKEGQCHDGFRN